MIVKIKFKDDNAKALYQKADKEGDGFPFKGHDDDFCHDCIATSCEELAPNVYCYGLGISLQMCPQGLLLDDKKYSIDVRPRSSVWKTGMVLSNCEGTIDLGYTGEIKAVFYHVLPNMPKYEVGDKICQLKIGTTEEIYFIEVDSLDKTSRGDGGYGSTGK